jgi:hypothetical protein
MFRGNPALLITPNVDDPNAAPGAAKAGVLVMLKGLGSELKP